VIETVSENDNICAYFDLPVQHASNPVLKRMGRHYTRSDLYRIIDEIRSKLPDAVLRTTVITGFPGETDEDFKQLMSFIDDVRFDHLGTFVYSDADDIPSHRLKHHVPGEIAKERHHQIMSKQVGISSANLKKYRGNVLSVLVEEKLEDKVFVGRTCYQAPEVDGITYIHSDGLQPGRFADIRISDTLEYDLIGETV
jgi:ribosomal protein S12 methylthiotransferase